MATIFPIERSAMTTRIALIPVGLAALLALTTMPALAQTPAADRPSWAKPLAPSVTLNISTPKEPEPEPTGIRVVNVTSREQLIPLALKLRYSTAIVLPEGDEVLDIGGGDTTFWQIDSFRTEPSLTAKNIVHVKPSKAGAESNLNIVSVKGNVYAFDLREGAKVPDRAVYLKVPETVKVLPRKYYDAEQYEAVQAQLIEARAQLDGVRRHVEEQIAEAKRLGAASLTCDYGPVPNVKPFFVQSICRTAGFTYIRTAAKELPALYEVLDGQPSVLQFNVVQGTYVVPKVLENGYLAIGKARLPFALKTGAGN